MHVFGTGLGYLLTSFPGSCVSGEARQPMGPNIPKDFWNCRLDHWGVQIFRYSASGLEGNYNFGWVHFLLLLQAGGVQSSWAP